MNPQNQPKGKPRSYVHAGTVINLNGVKLLIDSLGIKRKSGKSWPPPKAKGLQLLNFIAQHEGTLWTPEEKAIYEKASITDEATNKKIRGTGPGELSRRLRANLLHAKTPRSSGSVDIPELSTEVKDVKDLKIKPGGYAQKQWGYAKRDLYQLDMESLLVPGVKQFLHTNLEPGLTYTEIVETELTIKLLEQFPEEAKKFIYDRMSSDLVLGCYPNIDGVWPDGFIHIPGSDFKEAWKYIGTSQAIPRYRLSYEYLEKRARLINQKLEKKMKKIGIVAGSFKPFHRGHLALVDIASRENDEVRLFISLTDRPRPGEVIVKGDTMERIWREHYSKTVPKNVVIEYLPKSKSPVGAAYEFLGKENEAGSDDLYRLYGTPSDVAERFPTGSLEKYADGLWARRQIELMPVSRGETVAVSGSDMRGFLAKGDRDSFIENSPPDVGQYAWDMLQADGIEIAPLTKPKTKRVKK